MFQAIISGFRGPGLGADAFAFFDHDEPLAVAHRGGLGLWPENTLHAFRQADALGATCFELDVHQTADGHLVVCHDPTLDRTTDGSGAIREMTLAEIQCHDAGYHWTQDNGATHPFRGQGIGVPSLRELFEAFPDQRYIIDNKPKRPEMAVALAQLAVDCGVADRVCLASFYRENVLAIREAFPRIATSCSEAEVQAFAVFVYSGFGRCYKAAAPCFQLPAYQYGLPLITRPFMAVARRNGMEAHLWTINDPDEMRTLLAKGVRGIITDFPDRAISAIRGLQPRSES